jgi:hypothetical protein
LSGASSTPAHRVTHQTSGGELIIGGIGAINELAAASDQPMDSIEI